MIRANRGKGMTNTALLRTVEQAAMCRTKSLESLVAEVNRIGGSAVAEDRTWLAVAEMMRRTAENVAPNLLKEAGRVLGLAQKSHHTAAEWSELRASAEQLWEKLKPHMTQ